MALVTKSFSDIITFTRTGTTATYFNSAGVLTSAGADVPRFDYNPATLAAQGLLIEEQRTNLLLQSADFGTTWIPAFSTIAVNATASPDSGTNGDKLQESTVTNEHYVRQFLTGLTTNTTYTVSVFVKAAERTRFVIRAIDTDNVANGYTGTYNLTSVTASGAGSGTGSITGTPSITSVGNGWFRCVVSGNVSTGTKYTVDFFLMNAAGSLNYLGVAGEGLFLWGAQCELGAFPTSYIPTTTMALTRSADVASVNTLSPWYNASAGTLYAEILRQTTTGYPGRARFSDGTANNAIDLYYDAAANSSTFEIKSGGTPSVQIYGGGGALNTVVKAAAAWETNNAAVVYDGSVQGTDTSVVVPSGINQIRLANALTGYLRRITYYPRRLSNAELQAITA